MFPGACTGVMYNMPAPLVLLQKCRRQLVLLQGHVQALSRPCLNACLVASWQEIALELHSQKRRGNLSIVCVFMVKLTRAQALKHTVLVQAVEGALAVLVRGNVQRAAHQRISERA
jgi:hypothetical protein